MTALALPAGRWVWADDLAGWISARHPGTTLDAARAELNTAWRSGRISAFHGRSAGKEPRPVPEHVSGHPCAAVVHGSRIVGAAGIVEIPRGDGLKQAVLLHAIEYSGVRFTRVDSLAIWPEPGTEAAKQPYDFREACSMLFGLKVAGAPRPSREEAQTDLSGRFSGVSRDKAEAVVKKVWGEGKRGPRNPRNSRSATGAKPLAATTNPRNSPRK